MKIFHETDPLKRFRAKAAQEKLVTEKECDEIDAACEEKIKAAKKFAMSCEYPDSADFMKYVYVED
ncbi:hypothetical protein SDC9_210157 [bioreactor metagenome]|uniref:Dehydrogenase E1 component domain-containing protein n=1 Tax=bioreactor metagenome TaxID=1076179 RepID=A0A645JH26_9ZZZZ